ADTQSALADERAVDGDVGVLLKHDGPALARQRGIAPDDGVVTDHDRLLMPALGVENTVVIDHHAVAQHDSMRMPDRDVAPDHHAAAASAEHRSIQLLTSKVSRSPGNAAQKGRA